MKRVKTKHATVIICYHTDCKFNERQDTFYVCSKKQIHLFGHHSSDHQDWPMMMMCEGRKVKKGYYDDTVDVGLNPANSNTLKDKNKRSVR